ncbi:hypothetical protein [Amycolatopsis nigrescens]|uniref:hypothetical protein n=1 Tax=Amycolatopsis nigrescens TaxID=381445 RepID=UPI000362D510|nr:hypothetical protein [Amycolatopsis nigrescens]
MAGDEERKTPRKPDRRQVDAVFGDVLPDTTSDERDPEAARENTDSWYLENRPPHHGD